MDKVTQANAANAEESASASEEMTAQAQELNSMIAEFKLNQSGSGRKQITAGAPKAQKREEVRSVKKKEVDQSRKPEAVIPLNDDSKVDDADFADF